jgi:hypothetical protein
MPISKGIPAPDFELEDETGTRKRLSYIFTQRMIRRDVQRKPVISVMITIAMKLQGLPSLG